MLFRIFRWSGNYFLPCLVEISYYIVYWHNQQESQNQVWLWYWHQIISTSKSGFILHIYICVILNSAVFFLQLGEDFTCFTETTKNISPLKSSINPYSPHGNWSVMMKIILIASNISDNIFMVCFQQAEVKKKKEKKCCRLKWWRAKLWELLAAGAIMGPPTTDRKPPV